MRFASRSRTKHRRVICRRPQGQLSLVGRPAIHYLRSYTGCGWSTQRDAPYGWSVTRVACGAGESSLDSRERLDHAGGFERSIPPSKLDLTEHAGVGQLANCEVSSLETATYEPRCCRDGHDGR